MRRCVGLPHADEDELSFSVQYGEQSVILHQEVIDTVHAWDSAGREINI
jgi:hypothetical protein